MCKSRRIYRHLVAPLSIQIEVTSRCNCKCQHCYNYWRGDNTGTAIENMKLSTAEKLVAECKDNHLFSAVITGGEPFLNFPVAKWLAENLKKNKIRVSFNTNLSLVTGEHIKWLVDNKFPVLTSVLGPNSEIHDKITTLNGSFEKTIHGIERMVEHNASPAVNIVASRLNLEHLEQTLEILYQKGIKAFSITPAVQPEYCQDFSALALNNTELVYCLNLLTRFKRKYAVRTDTLTCIPLCALADAEESLYFARRKCTIGRGQVVCGSDGSIRACTHYSIPEGNILQESLESIWKRFEKWCFIDKLPETCINCKLLGLCNGGCRVEAEVHIGGISDMDPKANPSNIDKISNKIQEKPQHLATECGEIFKILPYRYRNEEFGVSVGQTDDFSDVMFLTHEAWAILRSFKVGELYRVNEVMNGVSDEDKKNLLIGLRHCHLLQFV